MDANSNEEVVAGIARKLALWHTKTFRPITTHEELEPIMATLGFVGMPPSQEGNWKEYRFEGRAAAALLLDHSPHVRLPYPRIDGLHVLVYRAFCDALALCLGSADISDHFHVRGVPLHPTRDRPLDQFRRMYDDEWQYVYREGTADPSAPWIGRISFHGAMEGSFREWPIMGSSSSSQNYSNNSFSTFQVSLNDICYIV